MYVHAYIIIYAPIFHLTNYLIARLNSSSSTYMHVSAAVHVSSIMIKYVQ